MGNTEEIMDSLLSRKDDSHTYGHMYVQADFNGSKWLFCGRSGNIARWTFFSPLESADKHRHTNNSCHLEVSQQTINKQTQTSTHLTSPFIAKGSPEDDSP